MNESVELGGDTIGWFRLQPTVGIQEFEFRMAPEAGNPAPDIDIVTVEAGQAKRLSDYRGKVVLLELWATWCGPCKPAMKKLNSVAAKSPDWADRVVIIPLSVDNSSEPVADHVARAGWTALQHFWSPRAEDGQSRAEQAFVVNGIPTAILVRPDGTIAWRGHPLAKYSGGVDLRDRIEAVLDGK